MGSLFRFVILNIKMFYLRRSWHKHHGSYTFILKIRSSLGKLSYQDSEIASPGIFYSLRFVGVVPLMSKGIAVNELQLTRSS